jgi:protein-S-isoprenylcysteine O-methyltransferase Ste14
LEEKEKIMTKQNNTVLIVVFVVLLVLVGFGGFGRLGMMNSGYGFSGMCSMMGGIWCYWPSFGFVIQFLIVVALVLFIIWIVKLLQGERK